MRRRYNSLLKVADAASAHQQLARPCFRREPPSSTTSAAGAAAASGERRSWRAAADLQRRAAFEGMLPERGWQSVDTQPSDGLVVPMSWQGSKQAAYNVPDPLGTHKTWNAALSSLEKVLDDFASEAHPGPGMRQLVEPQSPPTLAAQRLDDLLDKLPHHESPRKQAMQLPPVADFEPTESWQVVPEGAICPPGLHFKVDLASGLTMARQPLLPPKSSSTGGRVE
eukprot:TRINITY_DN28618_c0_g1_i1.p1 TRINITY_DN28618_c0_g1~~TRINITY_DN28618_c0_g1_i1.p1  ORF type:complete len:225 (-),score=31.51 TRINITY_DN28618_c0_g1_i1:320-994(-)